MNVAQKFGLVLRQARIEAKLSQVELAERSGYDRAFIGRLERGERQPTITTMFDLADTLGISATEMIKKVERRLR